MLGRAVRGPAPGKASRGYDGSAGSRAAGGHAGDGAILGEGGGCRGSWGFGFLGAGGTLGFLPLFSENIASIWFLPFTPLLVHCSTCFSMVSKDKL